jgi:hypothetical protein
LQARLNGLLRSSKAAYGVRQKTVRYLGIFGLIWEPRMHMHGMYSVLNQKKYTGIYVKVGHDGPQIRWTLGDIARAPPMIRKLKSGEYRLYSRKLNPKTGKRRNLGTFKTRAAAEKHERAVQYFKRHG